MQHIFHEANIFSLRVKHGGICQKLSLVVAVGDHKTKKVNFSQGDCFIRGSIIHTRL